MKANRLYSVTAVYRHNKINAAPKDKQPVICSCREDIENVIATTWKHEQEEDIMIDVYEEEGNGYYLRERWPYETFKKAKQRPDNRDTRLVYCDDPKARNIFY